MLGLVDVAHRPAMTACASSIACASARSGDAGTAEAHGDGIQHRHDVVQARAERVTRRAVPGGAVAQPGEDAGRAPRAAARSS